MDKNEQNPTEIHAIGFRKLCLASGTEFSKKPMEHLGKQLNVPGSFWQGHMLEDERDKIYKCTIVDFLLAQKVAPNS